MLLLDVRADELLLVVLPEHRPVPPHEIAVKFGRNLTAKPGAFGPQLGPGHACGLQLLDAPPQQGLSLGEGGGRGCRWG